MENTPEQDWPYRKRNFIGGLLHGGFFQFGAALSQDATVIPAFIYALTGSTLLVGAVSAIKRAGSVLPQLVFASFLETKRCKRPYLIGVLYFRSAVWFLLAWVTAALASRHPEVAAPLVLLLLGLFFLAGGLGELVYSYLVARTIPPRRRGAFFGLRQFLGGVAGLLAGVVSHRILANPANELQDGYGRLFLLTAASIAVAGLGFVILREPEDEESRPVASLTDYLHESMDLARASPKFRKLVWLSVGLYSIYLALPYFVVFARESLDEPPAHIGLYVGAIAFGQAVSGLGWGLLGDRHGYRLVLIGAAATTLLSVAASLGASSWSPLLAATFFFAGTGLRGADLGTRNYLFEITSAHLVPTCMALKNTLTAPTLLFPLMGGVIVEELGYRSLFLLCLALLAATLVFALAMPEPRKRHETTEPA